VYLYFAVLFLTLSISGCPLPQNKRPDPFWGFFNKAGNNQTNSENAAKVTFTVRKDHGFIDRTYYIFVNDAPKIRLEEGQYYEFYEAPGDHFIDIKWIIERVDPGGTLGASLIFFPFIVLPYEYEEVSWRFKYNFEIKKNHIFVIQPTENLEKDKISIVGPLESFPADINIENYTLITPLKF
jgi:hypothetical protein